jgi:hypothetical protein
VSDEAKLKPGDLALAAGLEKAFRLGADHGVREVVRLMDSLELAWGIIANAHGGDWSEASPEWREAAERWRDMHWHEALRRNKSIAPVSEPAQPCPTCGGDGRVLAGNSVWPCTSCRGGGA